MRNHREILRTEAEERNKLTPLERTRQYRLHPEKFAQPEVTEVTA